MRYVSQRNETSMSKRIQACAAAWMNPEHMLLSEVAQAQSKCLLSPNGSTTLSEGGHTVHRGLEHSSCYLCLCHKYLGREYVSSRCQSLFQPPGSLNQREGDACPSVCMGMEASQTGLTRGWAKSRSVAARKLRRVGDW